MAPIGPQIPCELKIIVACRANHLHIFLETSQNKVTN